jgi:hypothetical protein
LFVGHIRHEHRLFGIEPHATWHFISL